MSYNSSSAPNEMKPKLIIDGPVYDEIMFYVNRSHFEVSGMGKVVQEEGGIFRVVSQIMLPQKNMRTHTQVEPEDINKLLFEMGESPRFWWHSHVKMGVFWSGEDHDTIKANAGPNGWFINTVFNQDRQYRTAFYKAKGLIMPWGELPIWYDECETKIDRDKDPRAAEWEKTYQKNVINVGYGGTPGFDYQGGYYGKKQGAGATNETSSEIGKALALAGSTTTKQKNGSQNTTRDITWDFSEKPPETRPKFMKKRVYKAWCEAWNRKVKNAAEAVIHKEEPDLDISVVFTQDERRLLLHSGYTEHDVKFLFNEDFSPADILLMVRAELIPVDIRYYLLLHMTPADIMEDIKKDILNKEGSLDAKPGIKTAGKVEGAVKLERIGL